MAIDKLHCQGALSYCLTSISNLPLNLAPPYAPHNIPTERDPTMAIFLCFGGDMLRFLLSEVYGLFSFEVGDGARADVGCAQEDVLVLVLMFGQQGASNHPTKFKFYVMEFHTSLSGFFSVFLESKFIEFCFY
jgi:hypothetical protein